MPEQADNPGALDLRQSGGLLSGSPRNPALAGDCGEHIGLPSVELRRWPPGTVLYGFLVFRNTDGGIVVGFLLAIGAYPGACHRTICFADAAVSARFLNDVKKALLIAHPELQAYPQLRNRRWEG